MPEWLMGADCKSAGYAYVGSNPTRPKNIVCNFSTSDFLAQKVKKFCFNQESIRNQQQKRRFLKV